VTGYPLFAPLLTPLTGLFLEPSYFRAPLVPIRRGFEGERGANDLGFVPGLAVDHQADRQSSIIETAGDRDRAKSEQVPDHGVPRVARVPVLVTLLGRVDLGQGPGGAWRRGGDEHIDFAKRLFRFLGKGGGGAAGAKIIRRGDRPALREAELKGRIIGFEAGQAVLMRERRLDTADPHARIGFQRATRLRHREALNMRAKASENGRRRFDRGGDFGVLILNEKILRDPNSQTTGTRF